MVKVNGKPILEHLVNQLNKAGITEIIVNVHKDYDKIFKYFGTRLVYFYEPILMGEHGTEQALQGWLGDQYIVMNGDTLNNLNLAKFINGSLDSKCYFNRWVNPVDGHYAGTMFVNKRMIIDYGEGPGFEKGYASSISYLEDGEYYFDVGTPAKLAKARRYYVRNR